MIVRILLFCFMFLLSAPVVAQESLTIDLASDHVDITTGFDGADLVLYGVKDKNVDVAVVIQGPEKKTIVRKKGRVLGAWMNTQSMVFDGVPGFYHYALSKPESEFENGILNKFEIGLNALLFKPEEAPPQKERIKEFQEAMVRNKQAQGLFPLKASPIRFLNDGFFRTNIYLPSNVPIGTYTIKTLLLNDNEIVEEKKLSLKVAQVGMSARILKFATDQSLYYGLLCVFMALLAGWLINAIRNR